MTTHYRKTLKLAARHLNEAENNLKDALVNVAFAGVYKEITDVCDKGDEIEMHEAYFENTGDANVDLLFNVVKELYTAKLSLMNLNAIELNEDG